MIARMSKRLGFSCRPEELRGLAQAVLERARRGGASGTECDVSEGYGLSVTVRRRADVVEHNRDRSIGVSVYLGSRPKARRGHASTSDFSRVARADGGRRARHRAPYRRGRLRRPARGGRAGARDLPDPRSCSIRGHRHRGGDRARPALRGGRLRRVEEDHQFEGATVSAQHSQFVFANSWDLSAGTPGRATTSPARCCRHTGPHAARRLAQRLARAAADRRTPRARPLRR
jgi:PmbA protein